VTSGSQVGSQRGAQEAPATAGLRAKGIGVHFDGVRAVQSVDLALARGEVLGLIGPNGSGKTTTLNILSGYVQPTEGRVVVDGHDTTDLDPYHIVRAGLTRTFQSVKLFGRMTVFENVEVAAIGAGVKRRAARRRATEVIQELRLDDLATTPASQIPAGDERRVGIARALATEPAYLLLDEPAAGLDEGEGEWLISSIKTIVRDRGCGVLLVEHDMRIVLETCDRLQVLDSGSVVAVGPPAQVRNDRKVQELYFGTRQG
jgi:branched-chain amino acid transport system ATP-binding protein